MTDIDDKLRHILHDLRGPLTTVQGFIRKIQEEPLASQMQEFQQAASRSLDKIKNVMQELDNLIKR